MSYYAAKLAGRRLQRCYDVAPPRVQQYLESEIRHLLGHLRQEDSVLELGCGYGRVALRLAPHVRRVVGIDTAPESLELARRLAEDDPRCEFLERDALDTGFPDDAFDAVVCVQNGIGAFGVDRGRLLLEALRVAGPGGLLLFSTYADRFWPHRLEWFEAQAREGLVGPVDRAASHDGVIVCADGFRAGRATPLELRALCLTLGLEPEIAEVDGSSVFCRIRKPGT